MQLTYAFVYYFLITFIVLSFSLIIFALAPIRRLLHKVQTKYQNVLNNNYWRYTINFSFAIIFLILADSIRVFWSLNDQFKQHEHTISKIGLQRMDIIKGQVGESMIGVLKEHREYYLVERNIMMTCSALFVYFVFQRLIFNIRKLADQEYRREHPEAKSVILEVIKSSVDSHVQTAPGDAHAKKD